VRRRAFDYFDLLFVPTTVPHVQVAWRPAADVYRCEHGWLVKFDLAGVRKGDVEIHVSGATVKVSGTRRDWRVYERQEAHSMEIEYSHFERCIELPEEISKAEVRTEYLDGMLLVHLLERQRADQ
jgi:HSP20 family molecular chaperone IbpA